MRKPWKCLLHPKSGRTFHPRPTCFWMTDSLPSRQGVVALQGPSVDVSRHVGHAKSQCDRVMAWEPASQTEQGAFIWPHQGNLRNETAWGGSSWQLPVCLSTPDLAQLPSITVCVWGVMWNHVSSSGVPISDHLLQVRPYGNSLL